MLDRIPATLALGAALAAQGVRVDWNPTAPTVVLNTDQTVLRIGANRYTVRGGVFVFRNVTIPRGTVIKGEGSNPLVLILAGTMRIDGEISVRGNDGKRVATTNSKSAHLPAVGGAAVCGGGAGGNGSPSTTDRSFTGQPGFGPFASPGFGGGGGRINCANSACGIGSGGGGGAFSTAGDPFYGTRPANSFLQPLGRGGFGCTSRFSAVLPGGQPGNLYFIDNQPGNDFLGVGYDVAGRKLVPGELPMFVGGSGGGGGGDYSSNCSSGDPNFFTDFRGGGGGSGGGALLIATTGSIVIGSGGGINADGGNGGGGAWAGSCNRGGGGGAGAGGMVVLYSQSGIDITVRGETYANSNFDFAVSADGGIGLLDTYGGGGVVTAKYPPTPQSNMNARPTGAMGGARFTPVYGSPRVQQP